MNIFNNCHDLVKNNPSIDHMDHLKKLIIELCELNEACEKGDMSEVYNTSCDCLFVLNNVWKSHFGALTSKEIEDIPLRYLNFIEVIRKIEKNLFDMFSYVLGYVEEKCSEFDITFDVPNMMTHAFEKNEAFVKEMKNKPTPTEDIL